MKTIKGLGISIYSSIDLLAALGTVVSPPERGGRKTSCSDRSQHITFNLRMGETKRPGLMG